MFRSSARWLTTLKLGERGEESCPRDRLKRLFAIKHSSTRWAIFRIDHEPSESLPKNCDPNKSNTKLKLLEAPHHFHPRGMGAHAAKTDLAIYMDSMVLSERTCVHRIVQAALPPRSMHFLRWAFFSKNPVAEKTTKIKTQATVQLTSTACG